MSPTPSAMGRVRSAAAVNTAIRAVAWRARGREWTQAERTLYALLRDEWLEAMLREELTTAA